MDQEPVDPRAPPEAAHRRRIERVELHGHSAALVRFRQQLAACATAGCAALIHGETGVGKERAARLLHALGRRPGRPLVIIDCLRATPATLTEPLAEARAGTLLLDRVESLDASAQQELLRLIARLLRRRAQPQLVSLAGSDLAPLVACGRFRPDLFYRLAAMRLYLPPLRERRADIAALAAAHLADLSPGPPGQSPRLHPDCLRALQRCGWPGNVRELHNVLTQGVQRARGGAELRLDHVVDLLEGPGPLLTLPRGLTLREVEERVVLATLTECNGNKLRAAARLGISRRTLYLKLARCRPSE